MVEAPKRIAILGGGVSGLATAYELKKLFGVACTVDVFERSKRAGGNCLTANMPFEAGAARFADLGVNDFNHATYTNVVEALDALGVGYEDLEDTASYFKPDGSLIYTIDGDYGTKMPAALEDAYRFFQAEAPKDYLAGRSLDYTIADYLREPKYQALSQDLGPLCIFPRVAAMYFCDDGGPEKMPFAAVMHYYVLQEGIGREKPPRKYWVKGTSGPDGWIDRLAKASGATIATSANRHFSPEDTGWGCLVQTLQHRHYDALVMACHASDALDALPADYDANVRAMLGRFRYTSSVAYAHTWPGVLPPNRLAWRTYNVAIRAPGSGYAGYSMTYVENRHQNDAKSATRNRYGLAEYFTTLNPITPIPEQYILRDPESGAPCTAQFRHNVLDANALTAQIELWNVLQGRNNLYFVGGWTCGAGLHTECWTAAAAVARQIYTRQPATGHTYAPHRVGAVAPDYMRRALGAP